MGAPRITLGAEARAALLAGVDAVADAVRVTLGPGGRAVVVGRPDALRVTTDGAAIARGLELDHPGARLIRTVAQATEQAAGDGTTTATVLAQAMIRAGLRHIAAGADPVALRRGVERAVAQAVEHLAE